MRTSRGLPFDASYACTSMHESGSGLFLITQSQTIHTHRWSQPPTQPGDGPFWAYAPYLPLESVNKEECDTNTSEAMVYALICMC